MSGRQRRQAGFTLAELLVASVLISIVMASVYTLFHSAVGTWRTLENDYDAYAEMRNAFTIIEQDIANAHRPAWHLFEGEKDEFTLFVITRPMDVEEDLGPHLMRVRYYYNQGKNEIVREEAMVEAALPKAPPRYQDLDRSRIKLKNEEKFVIASNVERFRVGYVWVPRKKRENPSDPPQRIPPLIVHRHEERWGIPQALELEVRFAANREDDPPLPLKLRLPFFCTTSRYREERLYSLIGDLL